MSSMSDLAFDEQVGVYNVLLNHLFTFQKVLAVTNSLMPSKSSFFGQELVGQGRVIALVRNSHHHL